MNAFLYTQEYHYKHAMCNLFNKNALKFLNTNFMLLSQQNVIVMNIIFPKMFVKQIIWSAGKFMVMRQTVLS